MVHCYYQNCLQLLITTSEYEWSHLVKKFPLLGEVLRPEAGAGIEKLGSSSRAQNGFRKFVWPPKLLTNNLLPLTAFGGGWGCCWGRPSGLSRRWRRWARGRRRAARGRGRLRREFRNLKQFVETVNKCWCRSKYSVNIKHNKFSRENLTRVKAWLELNC